MQFKNTSGLFFVTKRLSKKDKIQYIGSLEKSGEL
jgi:hypothetical protein